MPSKVKPHEWSDALLATLFGLGGPALGRYQNGLSYPTLQVIQKFDIVLGWSGAEQYALIPPYWEWPLQANGHGQKQGEPVDMRYAMKLRQVIKEWAEANPRTILASEVRQHPSIPARAGERPKKKEHNAAE